MTAPNIVEVATITGKTAVQLIGTSATAIVSNSAASGKVFKINTILVSNIDGTNSADVTVDYYNGSTGFKIANTIAVPADSTLVLTDKNNVLYLEENTKIRGGASAASDLEIIISYEEIS